MFWWPHAWAVWRVRACRGSGCAAGELGRSQYPAGWGSGGSWGAANSSTAVHQACTALRARLLAAAGGDARSPLYGLDPSGAVIASGTVRIGHASETLSAVVTRNHPEGIEATGDTRFMGDAPNYADYSIHTYGAHFAEMHVDADTAEIRLRRMLGVFSVGRVLNAKTARSQLIGGMICSTPPGRGFATFPSRSRSCCPG